MHTGGRHARVMCVERMQRYKLLKIRFHVIGVEDLSSANSSSEA